MKEFEAKELVARLKRIFRETRCFFEVTEKNCPEVDRFEIRATIKVKE